MLVVSATGGRWYSTCDVDHSAFELSVGLEVVVGVADLRDDGIRHGCFDSASRGDAGGGAHGDVGSDCDDGDGVLSIVVKIKHSLLDSAEATYLCRMKV